MDRGKLEKWGVEIGMAPRRYIALVNLIRSYKCKVLMEIGVNKGTRAKEMILTALETPGEVHYHGFDLFEDMTEEVRVQEISVWPWHEKRLYEYLRGIGVNVNLYKGYSKDTLPIFLKLDITPDFIFVDGGHEYETVASDWFYVRQIMGDDTIVVFDDYNNDESGWGCQRVIDSLNGDYKVELLEPIDLYLLKKANSHNRVKSEVKLVKVTRN